jgi:DNA-binding beta-propeller fold protein YncE
MKKFLISTALLVLSFSAAWSTPWAIVVTQTSRNVTIIDLGQSPPQVYGPFLSGQFGGGELLDVAITPDNDYALISDFFDQKIYRVDISNPTSPVLAGVISTPNFNPEDIAVSPNGRFAIVSDGAGGGGSNKLVFLDLNNFGSYSVYPLATTGAAAQAVDIAFDNRTVIACDRNAIRIIFGVVNAAYSGLVSESTLGTDGRCLNVTISPDGTTALVANGLDKNIAVYRITGVGTVVRGATPLVSGFHDYPQSIAFSPNGQRAYVVATGSPDSFSWLQVNGPGNVTMGGERAAFIFNNSDASYFGVDVLGVTPSGNFAVCGGNGAPKLTNRATLVNLTSFLATAIVGTPSDQAGVAVFPDPVLPPSNLSLASLTNNYIFYQEHYNHLTWQANSRTKTPIAHYRIYRKTTGAADSTYRQVGEVGGSTLDYDDRGLSSGDSYTYRVTAVNINNVESRPAEAGN